MFPRRPSSRVSIHLPRVELRSEMSPFGLDIGPWPARSVAVFVSVTWLASTTLAIIDVEPSSAPPTPPAAPPTPAPGGDGRLLDVYESVWLATKLYPEGNFIALYNQHLEGCLSVQAFVAPRGTRPVLGTRLTACDGDAASTPGARFLLVRAAEGLVNVCAAGGLCVNNGLRDGSPALLGRWTYSSSHQFSIASVDGGVQLTNRGSGTCLTAGYSQAKATPCDPKNSLQLWQICAPGAVRHRCWPRDVKDATPTAAL